MKNHFLILLFSFSLSFSLNAQCDIITHTFNTATGEFSFELNTNNGYVMYEDCMNECEQDQYWNGAHFSCEEECSERSICGFDFYVLAFYSPFPSANPLLFSPEETYVSIDGRDERPYFGFGYSHIVPVDELDRVLWLDRWKNERVCFKFHTIIHHCDGEDEICTETICN